MAKEYQINFIYRFNVPKSKKNITINKIKKEISKELNETGWISSWTQKNEMNDSKENNILFFTIKQTQGKFECKTILEKAEDGVIARTKGEYVVNLSTALSACAFCGLAGFFINSKVQDEKNKTPKQQIIDIYDNAAIKLNLK